MSAGPARRAAAHIVAPIAIALAVACLGCPGRAPEPLAPAPLSEAATLDSLRAAAAAGRPDLTLVWAERRRAFAPAEPLHMIGHAMALHDLAWAGAADGRVPAALRSSLQRVEVELRAMAILDSAGRAATEPRARAIAARLLGTQLENWGLRLDALRIYAQAFDAAPNDTAFAARMNDVIAVLRDPGATTSGPGRAARAGTR